MSDLNQTLCLDPDRLKEYSYLSKVSGGKPPFDMVLIRWVGNQVRFLAASHPLIATRVFTAQIDPDGSESGSVYVPASWWWTALQGAAKAIGRAERVNAELVVEPTMVWLKVPEVRYVSSTPWSQSKRLPNSWKWLTHMDEGDRWDGRLPSFNGGLLRMAVASLGLDKKGMMGCPISLRSTGGDPDKTDVAPMLLVAQGGEWRCLLMPVRMGDRDE